MHRVCIDLFCMDHIYTYICMYIYIYIYIFVSFLDCMCRIDYICCKYKLYTSDLWVLHRLYIAYIGCI